MLKLRILCDLGFEFWMDIPGFEGYYQASTYGRIKSVGRSITRGDGVVLNFEEKIKKQVLNKQGYLGCVLYKDGKGYGHNTQVWVAITFIPVPEKYRHLIGKKFGSGLPMLQVNHKDENKFNNMVENLEWMSAKDNTNYGDGIKKRAMAQRKCHCKPVIQLDINGNFIKEWYSAMEIERVLGFAQSHIGSCCLGKRNFAYGFKWKYKKKKGLK